MNTDIELARMYVFIGTSIWREATSREMLAFCVMEDLNSYMKIKRSSKGNGT